MKSISTWASQHILFTRYLLASLGIINLIVGVLLGINFFTHLPLWFVNVVGVGIVGFIFWIRKRTNNSTIKDKQLAYQLRTKALMGLYFCNFLLSIVAGQIMLNHVSDFKMHTSEYTVLKSIVESQSSTPSVSEVKKQKKINKISLWISKKVAKYQKIFTGDSEGTKNIYGVWMLLVGLFSAFVSGPLACGLACANMSALAVIVILLGLGSLIGGIYLVARYGFKGVEKRKADKIIQNILIGLGIGFLIAALIVIIKANGA